MGNNTTQAVSDVVNILAAALQLGANIGIDLAAVSSAVRLAQSEGRTLSTDELQQFVEQWAASDAAEQAAYETRTRP